MSVSEYSRGYSAGYARGMKRDAAQRQSEYAERERYRNAIKWACAHYGDNAFVQELARRAEMTEWLVTKK